MKIVNVEAIYIRQSEVKAQCDSGQDALIVRIRTDAGITGIDEVDSSPMAVKGTIKEPFTSTITTGLREILIGEDSLEAEYLWHRMYHRNIYSGRRGIAIHAMSGIDMALWDIKGKALGQPVWKLLGAGSTGKASGHTRVRCRVGGVVQPVPGGGARSFLFARARRPSDGAEHRYRRPGREGKGRRELWQLPPRGLVCGPAGNAENPTAVFRKPVDAGSKKQVTR